MRLQVSTPAAPRRRSARHRRRHRHWTALTLAALAVSILVCTAGGWLVLRGSAWGGALSAIFNAAVGLGCWYALWSRGGDPAGRRFRLLLGPAIAIPACVTAVRMTPLWGEGLNAASTVTAGVLLMLALADRLAQIEPLTALRAIAESLTVGLATSCLSWVAAFVNAPLSFLPTLLASGTVIGLCVTLITRARNAGLILAATGAIGLIVTSLGARWLHLSGLVGFDVLALRQPAQVPFWTMVVIGVLWAAAVPWDELLGTDAKAERRTGLVLASVVGLALVLLVAHVMDEPRMDVAGWWLLAGVVLSVWAREVVRAMQSHQLLLRLGGLARTDALTGLPNLRSLERRMRELSRLEHGTALVATLDVDRFKDVNDILGHGSGDELLATLGADLAGLGEGVEAFRVGGDEFVVIAVDPEPGELTDTLSRMATQAATRIPQASRLEITSSLGVDLMPLADATPEDLAACVIRSGHAMRKAKRSRVAVASYDDAMARAHARRLQVEQRLREGLDGIDVHFQPIVSLREGRVVGAEALARWTDPQVGVVPPSEFVEAAEDTGVIDALGRHVLRRALTGAVESGLIAAGHSLSVNVSALQLRQPVFASGFLRELRSAGVPADQVIIEVTESVLVQADDPAVATLSEVRRRGVRIALDDFGTGYSSLSYLTRLPVQLIKIDRSLTERLGQDRAEAITATIVQLAHQLQLDIVVEGVETVEQERWAQRLELDRMQGWLYSPAVDRADLAAMLDRQSLITERSRPGA